ncbi:MAG: hypothetical protein INR66_24550, partial [Gordonia polyisoprenivorans]|nr:hypothetical protein [Gordonia polyisoprenivorans]
GLTNTSVVEVGYDGTISLFNSAGTTKVVVTVEGYYTDASAGPAAGSYVGVTRTIVVDTRSGVGVAKAQIGAKKSVTVVLTGAAAPAGTRTVYLDAVIANATAAGSVSSGNGSSVNYIAGTTSGAMLAALDGSGRATFTNNGTAAIDLVLTEYGYASTSPTAGAGWRRNAPVRLANNVTIAKGSTIDVQVTGAGGLPTRGVNSVAVGIAVAGATAAGYIRAYPSGTAQPSGPSTMNYPATATRTSFTIVSPGPTGAIRLQNASSATDIRVYVDLFALYGDPQTTIAPAANAPTAIAQMSGDGTNPGAIEYAYVDDYGQLYHGYQVEPGDFANIQWTPATDQEAYSGPPSIAALSGDVALASAQHADSDIYGTASPSGPDWEDLADYGGSMAAPPAATPLSDGTGALFAVDTDGALWMYSLSASPRYWRKLGTAGLVDTPTLTAVSGGVQITGRTTTGAIQTASYKNGVLSAWTSLGGTVTGKAAVVAGWNGLLRVVAEQTDGRVIVKSQTAPGTWATSWTTIGAFVAGGAPAAALNTSGALVVLDRNRDGYVFQSNETSAGSGTFGAWKRVKKQTEPSATDVTITPISDTDTGWTWLAVFRTVDNSVRVVVPQTASGSTPMSTTGRPNFPRTNPQTTAVGSVIALAKPTRTDR